MIDAREIKRCPFCGGKARHGRGQKRKAATLYQNVGEWIWKPFIGCGPCGIDRDFESVEEALTWWNTRASRRRNRK